jgi:transmembrane sensor
VGRGQEDNPKPADRYSHPDPVTDEALDWLAYLQDEPDDPARRLAFQQWLAGDPVREEAVTRLERMRALPSLREATRQDAARVAGPMRTPAPVRGRHRASRMAAMAAAAALLLGIGLYEYPALMIRWQADYVTATGVIRRIALPDGSSMTLNTASAVALDFAGGRRQVTLLQGEAFFEVRKDADRPFRVTGHFSDAEVKGTAFAVRTDESEDSVLLTRGAVEVSRLSDPRDGRLLVPGQMVEATASGLSDAVAVDPNRPLAWLDGRIVVSDQPLGEALGELRRYFDGMIVIANRGAAATLVNGSFRLSDPEAAIRTLAASAGAATTRLPGGLLIIR